MEAIVAAALFGLLAGVMLGAGLVWYWWRQATAHQLDYWMEWKAEADAAYRWPERPAGVGRGRPRHITLATARRGRTPPGVWATYTRPMVAPQPLGSCNPNRPVVH